MAQEEDPHGLTLMDVLVNTLLLATVLLMLAATFIEPVKIENVPDPTTGTIINPTELTFKPTLDPVKAGCDLNLTFEMVGGNPAKLTLSIRTKLGNIPQDSIQVLFGVFDRQYWHITRPCWSDFSTYGDWEIILTTSDVADLPKAILLHGVRGLQPIRFSERQVFPKKQLQQLLLTISGDSNISDAMPKIVVQ